jgi:DMSO/TMAO reductase YedYZ molybdopterin-dependent catalytic subunit
MKRRHTIPGIDSRLLVKDALKLMPDPARRLFLKGGASLGALTLIAGCDVVDERSAEKLLKNVSRFNDRAQAFLFNPRKLAPTYSESQITRPFPFNAFYSRAMAPQVDGASYRLVVGGRIENKTPWTLEQLYQLPQETQVTRHVCVEGWSAIGSWTGAPLREFLGRIGADSRAKYVFFRCAEGYYTSIDMATALHPQTQMTFKFAGEILPAAYGFPMKIRIPTKLGFKNPKHVGELVVTNDYMGGYWEDQGYNWFSGS